ncbi:hypothetical protein Trydic_g22986 [Trypoxylus dichotomus]
MSWRYQKETRRSVKTSYGTQWTWKWRHRHHHHQELTTETVPAASIEKPRDIKEPDERNQPENQNLKPELENRVESTATPQHSPTTTLRRNPTKERRLPSRYRE